MNSLKRKGLRTWIEVDTSAIESNYHTLRSYVGEKVKMCAVVKSNANGNDLVSFSRKLAELGIDFLAVDSIVEALSLRSEGVTKPIIVLGYILPEMIESAFEQDVLVTVSHFECLEKVLDFAKEKSVKVKVHIKIDTGMRRQGFLLSDKEKLFQILSESKNELDVEGVYTHFADAKKKEDKVFTNNQISEFVVWKEDFSKHGFKPIFHASATAATVLYPEALFDMVRYGMGLCGYSSGIGLHNNVFNSLSPVLSWRSLISEIKIIKSGESIGYNRTYQAEGDMKIAIVPIGYWHGYNRLFSNKGVVIVNGKRCPVVGVVSMSMITIDITQVKDVAVGTLVTLIGEDGSNSIYADELSEIIEGSYHELLTRLNPLIKRLYI